MKEEFANIIKWMLSQHQEERDAMIKEGGNFASAEDYSDDTEGELATSLATGEEPPPLPPSPRVTGEFLGDDIYSNAVSPTQSIPPRN